MKSERLKLLPGRIVCVACGNDNLAGIYTNDDDSERWMIPPIDWLLDTNSGQMRFACSVECAEHFIRTASGDANT